MWVLEFTICTIIFDICDVSDFDSHVYCPILQLIDGCLCLFSFCVWKLQRTQILIRIIRGACWWQIIGLRCFTGSLVGAEAIL